MIVIFKVIIVSIALIIGVSTPYIVKKITKKDMAPDNIVEEICEEIVDNISGVNIDLTPDSPESHKKGQDLVQTSPSSDKEHNHGNE